MTKPQTIIIKIKVVNGKKMWVWNNRPYHSEYLARLAATKALHHLQNSIAK